MRKCMCMVCLPWLLNLICCLLICKVNEESLGTPCQPSAARWTHSRSIWTGARRHFLPRRWICQLELEGVLCSLGFVFSSQGHMRFLEVDRGGEMAVEEGWVTEMHTHTLTQSNIQGWIRCHLRRPPSHFLIFSHSFCWAQKGRAIPSNLLQMEQQILTRLEGRP